MNTPSPTLTFNGTHDQQTLAEEIFTLMVMQSAFFADNAPIRQTLTNLADFLSQQHERSSEEMAKAIDAALVQNSDIFTREEQESEVVYTTSRLGKHVPRADNNSHMFRNRLYEPERPLPIDDISVVVSTSRPALTTVEPVFISDYWQEQAAFAPTTPGERFYGDEDAEEGAEPEEEPALQPTELPAEADVFQAVSPPVGEVVPEEEATVPPASPSVAEVVAEAEAAGVPAVAPEHAEAAEAVSPEAPPEPVMPAPAEAPELPPAVVGAEMPAAEEAWQEEVAEAPAEAAEEAVELAPEPAAEDEAPEVEEIPEVVSTVDMVFTLPDGTPIDLSRPINHLLDDHGDVLEAALLESLDRDPLRRIVRFGRTLYPESAVVNMGKNDMRRIRDYIVEVGEPLPDTAIIADLYHYNPRQSPYEGFRFSLNYRLSREKDFEFVGVEGARLWSTKGLATIGTKRVKAGEMAQLTSYLAEGYDDSVTPQNIEAIQESGTGEHLLTFFEWAHGMLPFDASMAALFPPPLLAEQRRAVLRLESPQHYTSYLIEIRYPTGNRGGWIQGLEEFFHEHLVAGALITLAATEEPNIFTIAYEEMPPVEDRLLALDEKKNKFGFSTSTYACMVDEDHIVVQSKFGKLKNIKSLPMNERRKADVVLQHIFETVGDQVGTRTEPAYQLLLDDLYVAFNVLRPGSRSYLRVLLDDDEHCTADESLPELYTYIPEAEQDEADEEEELEEDPILSTWSAYDDEDYR